jgi:hypothetical protein
MITEDVPEPNSQLTPCATGPRDATREAPGRYWRISESGTWLHEDGTVAVRVVPDCWVGLAARSVGPEGAGDPLFDPLELQAEASARHMSEDMTTMLV